jgi:D-xylose 1-dehydrogenase (NADP+, D-xylono-1,5-lactone-forming)
LNKVRWGVLSTAHIARTQLIPAIRRADQAEIVAIASRGSKVHDVAAELQIAKAYESYEELLDDHEIDAVYIPLPNHLHKEWVFKAAQKGKHVLCEKPIALTAQEAQEMVQACQEHGVKLMEAFMYQLHPQHQRVREIIESGEIGEVKLFKSSHSFFLEDRAGDIRMKKEMGGGALYDVGCYSLHVLRSILQSEPVQVKGMGQLDSQTGVDLSSFLYLEMENGIPALIDCSFDMVSRNEYEVVGTKGSIKVPYAFRPDINGGIGKVVVHHNGATREERIPGDIYRLEVEHFSQAILHDNQPVQTGASSIQNMRVIDACYEAIHTGETVKIQ